MHDFIRVTVYLISFIAASYALQGVDFKRFMKKGHEAKALYIYFILAMALGYLAASFILGLSLNMVF